MNSQFAMSTVKFINKGYNNPRKIENGNFIKPAQNLPKHNNLNVVMENTINEQRKEQLDNGIMLNQKFANLNSKAKFIKSKIN